MVTHKSILRALLCVALNLPPVSFRAFDIHNAGVCTFRYDFPVRQDRIKVFSLSDRTDRLRSTVNRSVRPSSGVPVSMLAEGSSSQAKRLTCSRTHGSRYAARSWMHGGCKACFMQPAMAGQTIIRTLSTD